MHTRRRGAGGLSLLIMVATSGCLSPPQRLVEQNLTLHETNHVPLHQLPVPPPTSARVEQAFRQRLMDGTQVHLEIGQATLHCAQSLEQVSAHWLEQGLPPSKQRTQDGRVATIHYEQPAGDLGKLILWIRIDRETKGCRLHLRWARGEDR